MRSRYSVTNLKLVYTLMLRDHWDKTGKKMGFIHSILNFIFLELTALINERYCIHRFDFLLVGNDLLASIVSAIKLTEKGYTVLVHKCNPENEEYNLVLHESQRLITADNIMNLEELLGHTIGDCNSYEDLLRRLSEILVKINTHEKRSFITNGFKIINSETTIRLGQFYKNICWTQPISEIDTEKKYGFTHLRIENPKDHPFVNYQCALSFNGVIILSKLNSCISEDYFECVLDFTKIKSKLSDRYTYSSNDRITDIKSLITEIEIRGL